MRTIQTFVQDVLQELHVFLNNMIISGESLISTKKLFLIPIFMHQLKKVSIFPTTRSMIDKVLHEGEVLVKIWVMHTLSPPWKLFILQVKFELKDT